MGNALHISIMFRNNFEPELARLVREQTTKDNIARAMQEFVSQQEDELDQAEGAIIALDSLPKSTPSYIKRFIDIDRAWNSERIKTYLSYIITESLDDQIAKFQKIVDDNAPDSGACSRKERRRKREQELRLPELIDLLAARALRAVEHERGIVAPDEVQSMPGPEPKSLDIQHWPYTSFNTDRLKARREFRLKTEKAEAVAAKKEFNGKIRAELNGKRKKGHWEFKTEEDEVVARVFMRNIETIEEEAFARVYMESTKEGAITADSVVAKVKGKKEPSVLQEIGIV